MAVFDEQRLKAIKAEIRGVLIANKFPLTPEELCAELKGIVGFIIVFFLSFSYLNDQFWTETGFGPRLLALNKMRK